MESTPQTAPQAVWIFLPAKIVAMVAMPLAVRGRPSGSF